jgi:hypothetical protein
MQKPFRPTLRDIRVVLFTYAVEGCTTSHIRQRFWGGTSRTTVHHRLSRLIQRKYLISQRLPPTSNQGSGERWITTGPAALPLLREHLQLTPQEVRQMKRPFQLQHWQHDVQARTVQVLVELAVEQAALVMLDQWWSERALRRQVLKVADQIGQETVELTADGSFMLTMEGGRSHRYWLEVDRGTLSSVRLQPKLRAYLQSPQIGTVLFVVPSASRMNQISRWTRLAAQQVEADPSLLWLARADQLSSQNILTRPIWQSATGEHHALVELLLSNPTKTIHQPQSTEGDLTLQ